MARAANQSEIARAAGVSISTVSRALSNSPGISDELRGQIQGLAKELGYRGRGSLALTTRVVRTYVTVHLVNGGLVAFYSRLVESMKAGAHAAGLELELRLVQQSLDPQRILRDEAHEPTAATLLVGVDLTPELRAYFTAERPMVLVNTFDPEQRFDCVAPNNLYGARMATSQLLDAGHRQLLHLREQLRWTTLQRESGFREAVANVDGARGEVADIRGGDEILIPQIVAKHSFHDLRHTFACNYYASHVNMGNPPPWKRLQTLLGHKSQKTTMDIYLRHVDGKEPYISDMLGKYLNEMLNELP